MPQATGDDRKRVVEVIEATLQRFGRTKQRVWGDVISIELLENGRVIFTFQIANRFVQLEAPTHAPWVDVLLDSFSDLLASKMVALVERGAPRDFRDIYELCRSGLTDPVECWQLWRRRQSIAGSDTDIDRARLAVQTHLARIAQHRPLESITGEADRSHTQQVRDWFGNQFLEALNELRG
ncbi:MAG: nucleotidyl transferase AbiEii/AbiGii toxin family protein [Sedimentisphaerales bacterium]|jgi:predicted nucleotidyltransferase component of viral defense system|nr:nucleotidyl transferase AbiEii/AbiGii toxin family protein [Sedimentisphaerales bacterium]